MPTVPLNLMTTSINSTSVGLLWTAPQDPNGVIDHYKIQYGFDGDNTVVNVKGLDAIVKPLRGNTAYQFTVSACNERQCGDWSTSVVESTNIGGK